MENESECGVRRVDHCGSTYHTGRVELEQQNENVRTIRYDARYRGDFIALNEAWIEHYFVIEEMDRIQLDNLEDHILNPGGDTLFVLVGDVCVGTVALIPMKPGTVELAKMAITDGYQGRGLGNLLMKETIARAREMGADTIYLRSNTIMETAIHLYRKYGFRTTRLGSDPEYERCNIEMEMDLTKSGTF